ncbi:hypothetical protein FIC_02215 [Flavobacteriaceae bacterium 3519-10]|nr:hypothetical protein FIC_02215 [Flavobacteriaceae bacterium 3519-10]
MNEKTTQHLDYGAFWDFFQNNEQQFFNILKNYEEVEEKFLDVVLPKLNTINDDFLLLGGMCDEETAELIITVDGNIPSIVYAEELVSAAPILKNWRFTALKPESDIESSTISMGEMQFTKDNIFFYPNDDENYPDEIDLVFIHEDLNEENRNEITNGTFIFIDNYLGELNFLTQIDNFIITGKDEAEKELIPISKLKDFLSWREREFTEKYAGSKIATDEDSYSLFEANLENGLPLIATINTDLLKWDEKASHPWISVFRIEYEGDEHSGFPGEEDYEKFNSIEDEMLQLLKPAEGNLNIGRETAANLREIYFASRDFRKISKVFAETVRRYPEYTITFEIFKDKYWQSFERYGVH